MMRDDEPDRIRRFLLEIDGSVGNWEGRSNGQMLLKTPTVAVSFYTTKGRTLWQGKLGSKYENDYQQWLGSQNGSTNGPPPASHSSRAYGRFGSTPRATLPVLPTKGQKSTQNECEAFLLEMELESTRDKSSLWKKQPNGQLLAKLSRVGKGNMSFYTTTGTLLFQGRDQEGIKSTFYNWRQKRLQLFEKEFIENESSREERTRKRQKVEGKREGKPSIRSMKIAAMKQELHSYGESAVQFLERSEIESALDAARQASKAVPGGKCGDHAQDSHFSYAFSKHRNGSKQVFRTRQWHLWSIGQRTTTRRRMRVLQLSNVKAQVLPGRKGVSLLGKVQMQLREVVEGNGAQAPAQSAQGRWGIPPTYLPRLQEVQGQ